MKKHQLKDENASDTATVVEDTVSENRVSENDKLLRKAPRSQSRGNKNKSEVRSPRDDDTANDTPRAKPPLDTTKSATRINSNHSLREHANNEEKIETRRRLRSRSASRDRSSTADNKENKKRGHINEAYDSDASVSRAARNGAKEAADEETTKPEKKVKKRKKKAKKNEASAEPPEDNRILAVVIHESGKLRTDVNIYHPMVRIHIVDLDQNGQYVKKLHRDRNVSFYHEKESGRIDYVAPIMTTPYDFKTHKSLIPRWEEIIVFNESFTHFTQDHPNVLILFEILDTMKISKASEVYSVSGKQSGWQRIAWAFLKLVGSDKTLNTEKKIRLQLFYSQSLYSEALSTDLIPEVYNLYKSGNLIKYPSTLTITVKSVLPPKKFTPCLRSFYVFQQEKAGTDEEEDHMATDRDEETINEHKKQDDAEKLSASTNLTSPQAKSSRPILSEKKSVIWSRMAGQPCRIPNDLLLTLPSGKNGCYSIRFSQSGSYIACGCVEENNISPVFVYEIPDGKLAVKFTGHFGLIYDLDWSKYDKYLLTASNDATARVFDMNSKTRDAVKILPHPTFVYTAKFHPNAEEIICTGGYDKVIRVWSIAKIGAYGLLVQELQGHAGFVNSMCFSNDGTKLYSADSNGKISIWDCFVTGVAYGKDVARDWRKEGDIVIEDITNQCINYIELHPNQRRMMVQTRDNQLRLIDIRIQAVIQRYYGALIYNDFMKSTMSPCGTFLFTSGADTKAYCWNIESGDLAPTNGINLNYLKQARDTQYHPFDNIIAFCAFGPHSPVYIFRYNVEKAAKDINYDTRAQYTISPRKTINPTISITQPLDTLPNVVTTQADDELLSTTARDQALASDNENLSPQRVDRLRKLHEQLDSIYSSTANMSTTTLTKKSPRKDDYDVSKINFNSSMTLSMKQHDKPEFKYNGPKETQDVVIVLYDYKAQRSDELNLTKGDELFVLVRDSPSWWMGELVKNRQQGYFPASYVQEKKITSAAQSKLNAKDFMNKLYDDPLDKLYSTTTVTKTKKADKINVINEIPTRDRPGTSSIKRKTPKSANNIDSVDQTTSEL